MDNSGDRAVPEHGLLAYDGRSDAGRNQAVQHSSERADVRRKRIAHEGLDREPGLPALAESKQQSDDFRPSFESAVAR